MYKFRQISLYLTFLLVAHFVSAQNPLDTIPTTIEDKDGNTFAINENRTITPLSGKSEIVLDNKTKNTPRLDIAKLNFVTTPNTKYALDDYKKVYAKVKDYYMDLEVSKEQELCM